MPDRVQEGGGDGPDEPARVLVVDDEAELVRTTCAALARFGFLVASAPDVERALDELRRAQDPAPYHVVVLDYCLHDGYGSRLLGPSNRLRLPPSFVVLTGYPDLAARDIRAEEIVGMLAKPARPRQLVGLARRGVSMTRARWQARRGMVGTPAVDDSVAEEAGKWDLPVTRMPIEGRIGVGSLFAAYPQGGDDMQNELREVIEQSTRLPDRAKQVLLPYFDGLLTPGVMEQTGIKKRETIDSRLYRLRRRPPHLDARAPGGMLRFILEEVDLAPLGGDSRASQLRGRFFSGACLGELFKRQLRDWARVPATDTSNPTREQLRQLLAAFVDSGDLQHVARELGQSLRVLHDWMSLLDDYDNMHCPGALVRFGVKAVDAQRDEMLRRLGGHPEREDRT